MNALSVLQRKQQAPEAWRYTDIAWLEKIEFGAPAQNVAQFILPAPVAPHRCVVVDGFYRADLSALNGLPEGFIVKGAGTQLDVGIAAGCCLALAPLELLYLWTTPAAPFAATTQLHVTLGESARLTLIERHVAQDSGAVIAHEPEATISLDAQAKLIHGKITEGHESYAQFARTKVTVAKGAYYDRFAMTLGGKLVRCETEVDLSGALAETRLLAVKLLRGASQADTSLTVRHLAPHGVSRQLVKAVLDDASRGVFRGMIHVAPGAQKTDGHQLSRALLLSDKAEMDAKPELEIYADDVKCSHGSAIGDLDEKALFYLRARGIPEAQARAMLIGAFVAEVIDLLSSQELVALTREKAGHEVDLS